MQGALFLRTLSSTTVGHEKRCGVYTFNLHSSDIFLFLLKLGSFATRDKAQMKASKLVRCYALCDTTSPGGDTFAPAFQNLLKHAQYSHQLGKENQAVELE